MTAIMAKRPTDIDSYISAAQPFAKPILIKLRSLFRKADPRLEEELKWGHPSFVYKGIVGGMASFKQHVSWGLWKGGMLKDSHGAIGSAASSVMGAGKLTDVSQLPPDRVV